MIMAVIEIMDMKIDNGNENLLLWSINQLTPYMLKVVRD